MSMRIDPSELERRLRDEAASERGAAPRDLVPRIVDALSREPLPAAAPAGLVPRVLDALAREQRGRGARAWWSPALFAFATAVVVIAATLAIARHAPPPAAPVAREWPVGEQPPRMRVVIPTPPLPDAPLAMAAPTRALETELHRVGHDADAACRFLLACVPSAPTPRAQP